MKIGRVCRHKEREGLDIVLNRGIYKKRFLVILAFASLMVSCGSDHSKLNELLSSSHCGECAEEHSADTQNPGVSQDPKITAGLVGWRDTVVLKLHDKVPSHIYGAAVNAAESWNKALGFELVSVNGYFSGERGDDLYASLGDDTSGIYFEDEWYDKTGKKDTIIATTVWEVDPDNRSKIVRGDVILNSQNYEFGDSLDKSLASNTNWPITDVESVLLHEIGHLIGLAHSSEDESSVMLSSASFLNGVTRRSLSAGDVENIRHRYSHFR